MLTVEKMHRVVSEVANESTYKRGDASVEKWSDAKESGNLKVSTGPVDARLYTGDGSSLCPDQTRSTMTLLFIREPQWTVDHCSVRWTKTRGICYRSVQ